MNKFLNVFVIFLFVNFLTGCDSETNNTGPDPLEEDYVYVLNDIVKGEPVVIFHHNSFNVFAAYSRRLQDGTILEFKNKKVPGLVELEDTEGNTWTYGGKAVAGSRTGTTLKAIGSVKGLWLAISACYQKVSLFNKPEEERIEYEDPITDWLINPSQIQEAADQDEIPALTNPEFSKLDIKNSQPGQISFSGDEEVIIVEHNNVVKIYPIRIMNWHEVVNDVIDGVPITISHCPLTATSKVFTYNGSTETLLFGVSGKLHNNNLILYDKKTNSLWSQIKNYSINGPLIGEELVPVPFLETKFKYVEQALVGSLNVSVMNFNTGYDMDYDVYPYGSYRTNNQIYYPLTYSDNRIPAKEVVLAIIVDNEAKVYRTTDVN